MNTSENKNKKIIPVGMVVLVTLEKANIKIMTTGLNDFRNT